MPHDRTLMVFHEEEGQGLEGGHADSGIFGDGETGNPRDRLPLILLEGHLRGHRHLLIAIACLKSSEATFALYNPSRPAVFPSNCIRERVTKITRTSHQTFIPHTGLHIDLSYSRTILAHSCPASVYAALSLA